MSKPPPDAGFISSGYTPIRANAGLEGHSAFTILRYLHPVPWVAAQEEKQTPLPKSGIRGGIPEGSRDIKGTGSEYYERLNAGTFKYI